MKKLYYEDSFQRQFTATVLACEATEDGYAVQLDQSAFFPGGGGQPEDYGTLEGQQVYKLIERDKKLYHVVKNSFEIGEKIQGCIDFDRRLDFMQQHSGEHIVSGIINQLYGYSNVGFHLSEETVTADFDGFLTDEQVREIEKLANEVVRKDEVVECKSYTQEVLRYKHFRSKKVFEEDIRLVSIGKSDCCACCGVHVKYSGQIGIIKILHAQKHRGGMRLTLKCGQRALEDYHNQLSANKEISKCLSVPIEDVAKGVKMLWQEKQNLKQRLYELEEKYFDTLCKHMPSMAPICKVEEALTQDAMRRFMRHLCLNTTWPCLILVPEKEGIKYTLGQREQKVSCICQALNERFEGSGGGKEMCQGYLKKGEVVEIQKWFHHFVLENNL